MNVLIKILAALKVLWPYAVQLLGKTKDPTAKEWAARIEPVPGDSAETGRQAKTAASVPDLSSAHLCQTCRQGDGKCQGKGVVFGSDRDPALCGADADKVVACESFESKA
jgi:hypothetical protein